MTNPSSGPPGMTTERPGLLAYYEKEPPPAIAGVVRYGDSEAGA